MEQVKNALQLFLRALPPSCHFNILGFGSKVQVITIANTLHFRDRCDKESTNMHSYSQYYHFYKPIAVHLRRRSRGSHNHSRCFNNRADTPKTA